MTQANNCKDIDELNYYCMTHNKRVVVKNGKLIGLCKES